jgi:serpin B
VNPLYATPANFYADIPASLSDSFWYRSEDAKPAKKRILHRHRRVPEESLPSASYTATSCPQIRPAIKLGGAHQPYAPPLPPYDGLPKAQSFSQRLGMKMLASHCSHGLPRGGVIVSPTSVASMLTMLAGGAKGHQAQQFLTAFNVKDSAELDLFSDMWSAARLGHLNDGREKTLHCASALFGISQVMLQPAFALHLKDRHAQTNFHHANLIDACSDINAWASNSTNGLIDHIVTTNMLNGKCVVLLDAIHFKAQWKVPFSSQRTIDRYPFEADHPQASGGTVPMMFLKEKRFSYFAASNFSAVRIPYQRCATGGDYAMVACLPRQGYSSVSLLGELAGSGLPPASSYASTQFDNFGLPKWKTQGLLPLQDLLTGLGFPLKEEFWGMDQNESVVLDAIQQKAIIEVDEQGTEAAAVTMAIGAYGCALQPAPEFNLIFNRPFVYAIVDQNNNALFCGAYTIT